MEAVLPFLTSPQKSHHVPLPYSVPWNQVTKGSPKSKEGNVKSATKFSDMFELLQVCTVVRTQQNI